MMRKALAAGLLVTPLHVTLAQPSPVAAVPAPADVAQLAWLSGAWEGEQDGMCMEERWTPPRGGTLLGVHRDVKGGRTVSFEFLRIEASAHGLVYHASPQGRPPTPFRAVETGARRVVFENREHDFPQRILYWRTGDTLHARIEGPRNGRTHAREWTWRRVGGG
jgi:hypothetical protein